jgi:hypothetical protein
MPASQSESTIPAETTASQQTDKKVGGVQATSAASDTATAAQPASGTEMTAAPSPELSAGNRFSVVDLKLAEKVADRNPVEPATSFSKGGKVFAWVKLNVKEPETPIRFQWFLNDSVVYTSDPVFVKQSPSWRSWQYKTVDNEGSWKVAILDQDDKVIGSQEFVVE